MKPTTPQSDFELSPQARACELNEQAMRLSQAQEDAAALTLLDQALGLHVDAKLHFNRAIVLMHQRQWHAAIADLEQAIALEPQFVDAYWNLAQVLLTLGDYAHGWPLLESGWGNGQRQLHHAQTAPLWQGQPLRRGQRLLLHSEQGLGDTIQFCRWAGVLVEQGIEVVLQVQSSLVTLLQSLSGVREVVSTQAPPPACDYQCALMSVPGLCHTTLDNIPLAQGYLHAQPHDVAQWHARLGPKSKPRIGLAWRGNPAFAHDARRSLTLDQWLPYLSDRFEWICLHPELSPKEKTLADQTQLRFVGDDLSDFAQTAALIQALDCVITSCTSVAHLSAALACPTWITLAYASDWRWLTDRTDSPWYQSVKLWRQPAPQDWDAVLRAISHNLACEGVELRT